MIDKGVAFSYIFNFFYLTGFVVLDQIRTVDRQRLIEKKGVLSPTECDGILAVLARMFAK